MRKISFAQTSCIGETASYIFILNCICLWSTLYAIDSSINILTFIAFKRTTKTLIKFLIKKLRTYAFSLISFDISWITIASLIFRITCIQISISESNACGTS
jgi:hypothetical protein